MRIGIFNDLHLGHCGEGRWHNRLLYERAEEIARAVVGAVNQQALERVVIVGDVTQHGTEPQVAFAREILGQINAPWYVVPGNHDRPAMCSGDFDRIFGEHAPGLYDRWGGIGVLFPRETLPADGSHPPVYRFGSELIEQAVEAVRADKPRHLLLFSHVPLVSEENHAQEHGAKYAGHFMDGRELMRRLEEVTKSRIRVFCAHQHWHHILWNKRWVQCTNGAMIEYPMEFRIVHIRGDSFHMSVWPGAPPELAAQSVDLEPWTIGSPLDREVEI
jgi:hypothetical protein